MKMFTTIPLLLYWLVNVWNPSEAVAQEGVFLKPLGNAGWDYKT